MSRNDPVDDERGVIVNTASIAAFEGQIGQVAYAAAKAESPALMLTMARDLEVSASARSRSPEPVLEGLTAGIPPECLSSSPARRLSETYGPARRIRPARRRDRREPDAQRRDNQARRRAAVRTEMRRSRAAVLAPPTSPSTGPATTPKPASTAHLLLGAFDRIGEQIATADPETGITSNARLRRPGH